jgi:hypothetical protein
MNEHICVKIRAQAEKIAKDCDRASIRDSLISARWYRWNLWLGLPSAILAALVAVLVSGGDESDLKSIIDQKKIHLLVILLASTSAILTSVVTFLTPSQKANVYQEFSNRYWALRDRIRKFALLECTSDASFKALKVAYEKLLQERIELDSKHPPVPEWAYRKAGKKLREKIERNQIPDEMPSGSNPIASLSGLDEDRAGFRATDGKGQALRQRQRVRHNSSKADSPLT